MLEKFKYLNFPSLSFGLSKLMLILLKFYSTKRKFVKVFFIVMFTSLLIKTQHLIGIIWKIEAVFHLFSSLHICCTILLSCGIAHAFSEQVKYCLFLHCFDMLVENTKEIMYQKWNRTLLADLIWTGGQHVLFFNGFVLFLFTLCMHTNHNNPNFLLIN